MRSPRDIENFPGYKMREDGRVLDPDGFVMKEFGGLGGGARFVRIRIPVPPNWKSRGFDRLLVENIHKRLFPRLPPKPIPTHRRKK
jgi:hypothetical protein